MSKTDIQILKLYEVVELVGLSKSSIYQKIKLNEFPAQIQLGMRSSGWHKREIEEWITSRPRVSEGREV